jgi:hypothetical protein
MICSRPFAEWTADDKAIRGQVFVMIGNRSLRPRFGR